MGRRDELLFGVPMKRLLFLLAFCLPLISAQGLTETLRPSAAGTTTLWTKSGSGGANWDRVNDQSDGTYVYVTQALNSLYVTDLYNLPATAIYSYDTIANVTIWVRGKSTDNTLLDVFALCRPTTTTYLSNRFYMTTGAANYSVVYTTNPQTSVAWQASDIGDLQVGVLASNVDGDGGTATATAYEVWVVITYSAGVPPNPAGLHASNTAVGIRGSNSGHTVRGKQ